MTRTTIILLSVLLAILFASCSGTRLVTWDADDMTGAVEPVFPPTVGVLNLHVTTDGTWTPDTYRWDQVVGPAPATIHESGQLETVVTMPKPGKYIFSLTATGYWKGGEDGALPSRKFSTAYLTIVVREAE